MITPKTEDRRPKTGSLSASRLSSVFCILYSKRKGSRGFTFIEVLIAVAVLAIISIGIMSAFAKTTETRTAARAKIVGTFLGNELIEKIRNLPYSSVGVIDSVPNGVLQRTEYLVRDGISFTVTTTVRNVDDPFDGTLGSLEKPDLASADYKLVEENIVCDACVNFSPIVMTTTVAPKDLESPDSGGGLLIKVFDASGQPINNASVHVVGTLATSTVTIDDHTNINGELTLVGLPPATNNYAISVSKSGYTSDRTYSVSELEPSVPVKPNATVATGALTSVGFSIDHSSSLLIKTKLGSCEAVPGVGVHVKGQKTIGVDPDRYILDAGYTTNSSGEKLLSGITWDNYLLTMTDPLYDLAGTLPFSPLSLLPGANQDFAFILRSKNPRALLITVKDSATNLPITEATVTIAQGATSYQKTTGRGAFAQSSWIGGGGQATSTQSVETSYFSSDGNVETSLVEGSMTLAKTGSEYAQSGVLTSSAFDTGTASTFYTLNWEPSSPPSSTTVRFQIATNNDGGTWNYVGPSGTGADYYATSSMTISADHNGDRYLRYRVFLDTASTTSIAPYLSDISFVYSTNCMPSGQVFWNGLLGGTWIVSVTHPDYIAVDDEDVFLGSNWQEKVIMMTHK